MQFIDLSKQQKLIRKKINARIESVLDRGQYINGEEVFELDELLANYVNVIRNRTTKNYICSWLVAY